MVYIFLVICNIIGLLHPDKVLVCHYTENPIKIDAQLNEKEWEFARSITLHDSRKRTDNQVIIRTLWDEQNLYVAFHVQDKDLQAKQTVLDHPQLYLDDMVEFLIDTRNDKDSCWNVDDVIYHINILGQKKDDRGTVNCITNPQWNGNARYAVQLFGTLNDTTDIDIGYDVEVSISWKELETKPGSLSVDFAVGDSGKLFDWVGASPFRSPFAFGNLILRKKDEVLVNIKLPQISKQKF